MQLLEAGGLQAGGPGEVGRTLRLVCARPTNSRGSRYPRCRPAVTTGHPESTWRVSRGLWDKLSHFSETARHRQGSRPGDSSDRPGQGRGDGAVPRMEWPWPYQSLPAPYPGSRILGLILGSKSLTRGHRTHYVTGDQQCPARPPLF